MIVSRKFYVIEYKDSGLYYAYESKFPFEKRLDKFDGSINLAFKYVKKELAKRVIDNSFQNDFAKKFLSVTHCPGIVEKLRNDDGSVKIEFHNTPLAQLD